MPSPEQHLEEDPEFKKWSSREIDPTIPVDPQMLEDNKKLALAFVARNSYCQGVLNRAQRRQRDHCITEEDLVQEAMIGLTIAIQRFDPGRGNKLSTYAWWCMRSRVYEQLRLSHHLSYPASVLHLIWKAENEAYKFRQEHDRNATVEELFEQLKKKGKITPAIRQILNHSIQVASLYIHHNLG